MSTATTAARGLTAEQTVLLGELRKYNYEYGIAVDDFKWPNRGSNLGANFNTLQTLNSLGQLILYKSVDFDGQPKMFIRPSSTRYAYTTSQIVRLDGMLYGDISLITLLPLLQPDWVIVDWTDVSRLLDTLYQKFNGGLLEFCPSFMSVGLTNSSFQQMKGELKKQQSLLDSIRQSMYPVDDAYIWQCLQHTITTSIQDRQNIIRETYNRYSLRFSHEAEVVIRHIDDQIMTGLRAATWIAKHERGQDNEEKWLISLPVNRGLIVELRSGVGSFELDIMHTLYMAVVLGSPDSLDCPFGLLVKIISTPLSSQFTWKALSDILDAIENLYRLDLIVVTEDGLKLRVGSWVRPNEVFAEQLEIIQQRSRQVRDHSDDIRLLSALDPSLIVGVDGAGNIVFSDRILQYNQYSSTGQLITAIQEIQSTTSSHLPRYIDYNAPPPPFQPLTGAGVEAEPPAYSAFTNPPPVTPQPGSRRRPPPRVQAPLQPTRPVVSARRVRPVYTATSTRPLPTYLRERQADIESPPPVYRDNSDYFYY